MTSALVKFCSSFTWEGRKWVQEEVGEGSAGGQGGWRLLSFPSAWDASGASKPLAAEATFV